MLFRLEAEEIRASSVSDCDASRSTRPANWAMARFSASPIMSVPLPTPSEVINARVAEFVVLLVSMFLRTAGGGAG